MHACPISPPPAHMVYVLFLDKELSLHIKQEPETMLFNSFFTMVHVLIDSESRVKSLNCKGLGF